MYLVQGWIFHGAHEKMQSVQTTTVRESEIFDFMSYMHNELIL